MAKQINQDDLTLLRAAMRDVTPIQVSERVVHALLLPSSQTIKKRREIATAHPPSVGVALSDAFAADSSGPADDTNYRGHGLSQDALRHLKRQRHLVKASLDLHGLTVDQARTQLHDFVQRCCAQGIKRVRVIHGQGFGSRNGTAVLKQHARHWLRQMPEVLGYTSPDAADGGSGAVLILLRSSKPVD